eukprot:4971790-Amphidinium_carterae.1
MNCCEALQMEGQSRNEVRSSIAQVCKTARCPRLSHGVNLFVPKWRRSRWPSPYLLSLLFVIL